MSSWTDMLGPLAWPLLLCSLAVFTLIVERSLLFIRIGHLPEAVSNELSNFVYAGDWAAAERVVQTMRGLAGEGIGLWLAHRATETTAREDLLAIWLAAQYRRFVAPLKWLALCAVVSPMLGLLGTVLGMVEAFRAVAAHTGPVYPALLADGLWQAMLTTAAGLSIAIPAIVSLHAFRIRAEAKLAQLEEILNRLNLALAGIVWRPAEVGVTNNTASVTEEVA